MKKVALLLCFISTSAFANYLCEPISQEAVRGNFRPTILKLSESVDGTVTKSSLWNSTVYFNNEEDALAAARRISSRVALADLYDEDGDLFSSEEEEERAFESDDLSGIVASLPLWGSMRDDERKIILEALDCLAHSSLKCNTRG